MWGPKAPRSASETATGRGVVSWIVSARTTAPHLPLLRGGEVVLIPPRATAVVGGELPALLREARLRDVAAVSSNEVSQESAASNPLNDGVAVLVWDGDLTADTETGNQSPVDRVPRQPLSRRNRPRAADD